MLVQPGPEALCLRLAVQVTAAAHVLKASPAAAVAAADHHVSAGQLVLQRCSGSSG